MDVLDLFGDIEKLGEEDEKSEIDPGEQAALKYQAVARGIAMAVPFANAPLAYHGLKGSTQWTGMAVRGVSRLGDFRPETAEQYVKPVDKKSFAGLFDLQSRPKSPGLVREELQELTALQPVVDSFIDKYDLAKKGVTMDFRYSPWGSLRGAKYDTATKILTMPRVSKEILLHELGHAADYTARAGLAKKFAQGILPAALLDGLIPAAYFVGDEIKKAIPGSTDDKIIEFTQQHGPALAMLAMAAKSLYPEGKASYLAIKHIHDVEGAAAAKAAAKKLLPLFGTYAMATLPILAGFSLAKKAFFGARERLDKKAGVLGEAGRPVVQFGKDVGGALTDVGKQMWHGISEMTKSPDPVHRLFASGEAIARSPEFQHGAIYIGVPAALAAYATYAHPGGKFRRDKVLASRERRVAAGQLSPRKLEEYRMEREYDAWREKHPAKWAARVGLGAGITGGLMTKLFSDVGQVV